MTDNAAEMERTPMENNRDPGSKYWSGRAVEHLFPNDYDQACVAPRVDAFLRLVQFDSFGSFNVGWATSAGNAPPTKFEEFLAAIENGDEDVVSDPCAIALVVMVAFPGPSANREGWETCCVTPCRKCVRDMNIEDLARHQNAVDALVDGLCGKNPKWVRDQIVGYLLKISKLHGGVEKLNPANVTRITDILPTLGVRKADAVVIRRIERLVMVTERPSKKRARDDMRACGFAVEEA